MSPGDRATADSDEPFSQWLRPLLVAIFIALAGIRRTQLVERPTGPRGGGDLRAAVRWVRHRPDVRRPLLVMVVVGLVVLNFQTTFPSMVRFGFDRGAGAVGTAMSVSAIGSIA